MNTELYSSNLNSFILETLLQKDHEKRLYVNQIMKFARDYFSDDTMRSYREKILPLIKAQYSSADIDYIY